MAPPNFNLTLFRGFPPNPRFVWSPFVTKLEARLRFDNVFYSLGGGSPRAGPRGKIPYLLVSESRDEDADSEMLSDTTLIINELISRGTLRDLNARLDPRDRALDAGVRSLLEDKLSFCQVRCAPYPITQPLPLLAG
jgi:hypothetical protein